MIYQKTSNKLIHKSGFTLIEILVGITIIIAVSTIVLSMLVSSFRISNKTTTTSVIRQNGNYALTQISRMLQYADSFNGASETTLYPVDSDQWIPRCPLPPNGVDYNHLNIRYNDVDVIISCLDSGISVGGATSIDITKVSVVPDSCKLICSQNAAEGPVIKIKFDLVSAGENNLVENKSRVNFSTTVKMRNQ